MKKLCFKIFMIISIFIFSPMINVLAADLKLTCDYKLTDIDYWDGTTTATADISYKVYSDDKMEFIWNGETREIVYRDKYDFRGGGSDKWTHSQSFITDFLKRAHPDSGGYKCPYLSYDVFNTTESAYVIEPSDNETMNETSDGTSDVAKIKLVKETVAEGTTQIKENQVCTYYIKEKLYDKEQASRVSSDTITVKLAIDTAGKKYFYVQDQKSNNTSTNADAIVEIPVFKAKQGGITYNDIIRFVVKPAYTADLFEQNFKQLEYNKFSCPTKLYVVRDKNYDVNDSNKYSYYISATDDSNDPGVLQATATGYIDDYVVDGDGTVVNSVTGEPLDCNDFVTKDGLNIISDIFNIIMIIGPILALVLGGVDFAKATLQSDESALKKAGTNFGKRIIAAILLFLLPLIINLIFSLAFSAGVFGTMENVPEVCLVKK